MAEHRHYAQPHPHWIDFPKNLPVGTKQYGMSRNRDPITSQGGLTIEELDVEARDGKPIPIRSYRQTANKEALPVLIYCHGGGFVTGGLETDDALCREIAAQIAVIVLNVEYRLATEHLFPIGFQDCHDVVCWVASNKGRATINADPTKGFLLGGTSAGGNFTCGIAHLALQERLSPPLSGLLFMASNVCHPDVVPKQWQDRILSVNEIDDPPGLTASSIRYFAGKYGAPSDDPRYSPLLFPSHSSLAPKVVLQVCGWDPRRDEMLLYDEILRQAGTATRCHIYSGLPHGFWQMCPDLEESQAAARDTVSGVAWMLE